MENVSMILSKNILKIAKIRHISVNHIESDLSYSAGYISRAAKGKKRLFIDFALAIAKYLNISLIDLLDETYIIKLEISELEKELWQKKKHLKTK